MKPLVAKTLEIATSHIGVREIGRSNRGPEVDRWLRMVGVGLGNPWCAAFTWANKQDAADALGVENLFIRSAYTPDIGNWARERRILIPCIQNGRVNKPEPGDDFLVMEETRFHHTGHVRSVEANSWTSIEGNSNSDGSREGFEVACNRGKPFASRFYWVRWSAILPDNYGQPRTRALYLGGRKVDDVPVRENVTLVSARKWAHWMGQTIAWRAGSDTPLVINGKPLETEITLIDGSAFVAVRDLTALDKTLAVSYDSKTQSVYVVRVK